MKTYLHPATLLRAYNVAQQRARDTYWLENHCRCGEFVAFNPMQAWRQRLCDRCKMQAGAA